jgi:hypothetical protein
VLPSGTNQREGSMGRGAPSRGGRVSEKGNVGNPTSENAQKANFAEFLFHALG